MNLTTMLGSDIHVIREVCTMNDDTSMESNGENEGAGKSMEKKMDRFLSLMSELMVTNQHLSQRIQVLESGGNSLNPRDSSFDATKTPSSPDMTPNVISNPYKKSRPRHVVKSNCGTKFISDKYGNIFDSYKAGEVNSRGGCYTTDCGARVFLSDENKFGEVVDETRFYFWLKVDGENYSPTAKGRKKLKANIKSSNNK